MNNQHLPQIERLSTQMLTESISDQIIFHDIEYTLRVVDEVKKLSIKEGVSQVETEVLIAAAWLFNLGFTDTAAFQKVSSPQDFFATCHKCSLMLAKQVMEEAGAPEDFQRQVYEIIDDVKPESEVKSKLGMIMSDAIASDWGKPKAKSRIKKLYNEFLLTGAVTYGKSTWYDTVLAYLREHHYYTESGQKKYDQHKLDLIGKIEKEKKELDKKANTLIKKELSIGDDELKKLKKSLSSVKGRDDRGIQTLFRTTSRNHYTMNQMMDRKANIMISINAILMSLVISRTIGGMDTFCIHNSPILVMLVAAVLSMAFAIVAITPFKTQGLFTESEIREKKGNLLYYGNFHSMNLRDFEWGMLEMLSDGDFLYSTMIRDLYFLGHTLHKKAKLIRVSLTLFIVGLVASTILFLFVASMSDFHFGVANHI